MKFFDFLFFSFLVIVNKAEETKKKKKITASKISDRKTNNFITKITPW